MEDTLTLLLVPSPLIPSPLIPSRETFMLCCMHPPSEKSVAKHLPVAGMVEDIVGCKWSLTVLQLISDGVSRPGAMQRQVDGLTAKVLNERLRKLMRFGIIEREVYAEVPPRVEYRLSDFGRRFGALLDQVAQLEQERG
jgi:DNA-binding HxlR family transcriptional regulator